MNQKPQFDILGKQIRQPVKQLETFSTPEDVTTVVMETHEFTSLCPVTGQPDFSTVRIEYKPGTLCLESKSLKLYLWTFREEGHFCEALSSLIAHDVFDALQPLWCKVTVTQNPRGGIGIVATSEVKGNG